MWTDADFERDEEWLNRLATAGERHGPATAIPFWYGNGAWSMLEPWTAVFSTLLIYYGIEATGNIGCGGGLTVTREELSITVEQLSEELRQVLSDDGLLSQHIDHFHAIKSMVTPVKIPGDVRSTYARLIRFNRLPHVQEGMTGDLVVSLVMLVAAVVYPLVVAPAVTLLTGRVYAVLGLRRPTFLLSYPGLFLIPLTILGGMFISEFEWAGRRYRLNGESDV